MADSHQPEQYFLEDGLYKYVFTTFLKSPATRLRSHLETLTLKTLLRATDRWQQLKDR